MTAPTPTAPTPRPGQKPGAHLPGARLLRAAWRLLASMRFAVGLLVVIALASVIGTVLPQHQPYSVYAGLYGAFWADVFDALGLFHVYQSTWYVLMLAFLVASTTACMARHVPVIVRDWRNCKEDISVQALQAMGQQARAVLPQAPQAAAQALGQQLADQGWRVRMQERALPHGSGWMVAARKGRLNRLGYLAGHGAVVLICVGGLLDSRWVLRAQMAWQNKTPYQGSGPVAQVPAQHRMGPDVLGFRGHVAVAEGRRNDAAIVAVPNGVVIQDLPFAVELRQFHIAYHPNGTPRLFASDVVLHDRHSGARLPARIAVNRPVQYRGVTLYQSGFDDGGSTVTLRAVPWNARIDARSGTRQAPAVLQGHVGGEIALPHGGEPRTLEIVSLNVVNMEDVGMEDASAESDAHGARTLARPPARQIAPASHAAAGVGAGAASAAQPAAANPLLRLLQQTWGGAHAAHAQPLRDVGPSITYRLRDAAGQATEFHNYMRPVQLGSPGHTVPQYLFGVRANATQSWRYLRVPADAAGGLDEFLRLRTALLDAQQRQQAARRYAQQAAPAGDAQLASQLEQSARRVLDSFAGEGAGASAGEIAGEIAGEGTGDRASERAGGTSAPASADVPAQAAVEIPTEAPATHARRFGLAGVAALVEAQAPPEQQEQLASALLRMLNGSLLQLLQAARAQAGLPPLDMAQPRNQAFMSQAVIALSDAPLYPEPVWFVLEGFQQRHASILQVARTPGKWLVYAGSTLLVLGVLAMLYVRERRLWIWLTPHIHHAPHMPHTPHAPQTGAPQAETADRAAANAATEAATDAACAPALAPSTTLPTAGTQALLGYVSTRRKHEGEREFAQLAPALLQQAYAERQP